PAVRAGSPRPNSPRARGPYRSPTATRRCNEEPVEGLDPATVDHDGIALVPNRRCTGRKPRPSSWIFGPISDKISVTSRTLRVSRDGMRHRLQEAMEAMGKHSRIRDGRSPTFDVLEERALLSVAIDVMELPPRPTVLIVFEDPSWSGAGRESALTSAQDL